jgi:hypothetical protein
MIIKTVTYTTQAGYAEQNLSNIKNVTTDLQMLNHQGVNFNAFLSIDGKTFMCTVYYKSNEDEKVLNELPSFVEYQEKLLASDLEGKPKVEHWNFIGSSNDIFNS